MRRPDASWIGRAGSPDSSRSVRKFRVQSGFGPADLAADAVKFGAGPGRQDGGVPGDVGIIDRDGGFAVVESVEGVLFAASWPL